MTERLTLGTRVKVTAKDVKGSVAYVGYPTFATGKWVGVVLDEAKGKNNGTVRGHAYFTCDENYGVFVRQTQLQLLDEYDNPMDTSVTSLTSESDAPPRETKPAARTRLSSSRTSLTGSRQSLAGLSYPSPTAELAATPDHINKRSAFVETGFVETLNPQFTPGQSITSPMAPPSTSVEDKLAAQKAQQEIAALKAEVEDLKEKLETLRVRRAEDREKLKELERVRMQLEQATEFKGKIMESQAQLQRDLQRARQETRDVQAALEAHTDETAELQEACEMAALDKEMAEERAEALQLELEQCRDKLEEATLDLQLMRAEMEAGGNTQHPYAAAEGGYEMRQLQQQNARMRDTLVRLRDLSAHDKHEMHKIMKDMEQKKSEVAELSRTKEKLSARVDELEAQVADLQEQVDAALGAEEMVEQLGEKKMSLEDQVEQLKQDVSELEALQEIHEQLVESNRELELDLREELEMAHAATREAAREKEAALETVMDRDGTIVKFRELVHKLTEQCNELRNQINAKQGSPAPSTESEGALETVARASPAVELGTLVSASRASTRSIDLQLRALELAQARARAEMLHACLPDHFNEPSGDHDAVLLILLLQRLHTKADIVLGQVRERFPAPSAWEREAVTKAHTHVQYSFRCQLEYQLQMLQCIVSMWSWALDRCTTEVLLRAASALPDAAAQERALDGALQLLKNGELDENCSVSGIEKCWTYLGAMWSALGVGSAVPGADTERSALVHACSALDALARALHVDASAIEAVIMSNERELEMGALGAHIRATSETLQQQLKAVRRRLPVGVALHNVGLDPQLVEKIRGPCAGALWKAVRTCGLACRAACSASALAGERGEGAPLPHEAIKTLYTTATDKIYHQEDATAAQSIKQSLALVASEVARLATFAQEKEYDMMSLTNTVTDKPVPPVVLRAQLVKKQLEETKTLTIKLENKEADIKELRKALKAKQEELSEMQIRRELGERKLTSAARDAELKAEQLQRRLEDTTNQLKRKEKEFEETMDHLQQDIDSLESERGALRDKLKLYAKRGGAHHAASVPTPAAPPPREYLAQEPGVKASAGSITGVGVTGAATADISEAVQHQLKVLSWAVERERAARVEACRRAERAALRSLRPLHHAAAHQQRRAAARALDVELQKLQFDWTMFIAKSGLVQFPEEPAKYERARQQHRERQNEIKRQLTERLEDLQRQVKEQLLLHRPWRRVDAALATFPTTDLTKALSGAGTAVGRISYPAPEGAEDTTIYMTPTQLTRLRELVTELGSDEIKLELEPGVCAA